MFGKTPPPAVPVIGEVLAELSRIAFGGIGDCLTISSNGEMVIDLTRCSPEVLNTLAMLACDVVGSSTENEAMVRRIRIKRLDKLRALDLLGNHLGLGRCNGQAEGQINRLKTSKRAMYGRVGPSLLRARVLPLHPTN